MAADYPVLEECDESQVMVVKGNKIMGHMKAATPRH